MTTLGAQKKRLVLITEGDAHMIEYFIHNGVIPSAVILTPAKFKEVVPYLSSSDDVLVVIKGLTDFSLAEVYVLLDDLAEAEEKLDNVAVFSNLDLGVTALPYYHYEGDLFYSRVRKVRSGKYSNYITDETEQQTTNQQSKRPKKDKKAKQIDLSEPIKTINPVLARYRLYSKLDTKMMIYGNEKTQVESEDTSNDFLKNKITVLDIFAKTDPQN